jgi:hypothetical protein
MVLGQILWYDYQGLVGKFSHFLTKWSEFIISSSKCCEWMEWNLFLFFPLLLCWVGVHCAIYKGSYSVPNKSYLESPPSTTLLYPLLIPGIISTVIIFGFIYICTHFLYNIHPPTPNMHPTILGPVNRN